MRPDGADTAAGGTATDAGPSAGPSAGTSGTPDPADRAREGLEHLQSAARELIAAARAMLDVAEDIVDDPDAVTQLVGSLGAFGDMVRQGAGLAARARPAPAGGPRPGAGGNGHADADGVQRITVL
jgi:hypothetical protein